MSQSEGYISAEAEFFENKTTKSEEKCNSIKFADFCSMLEKIENARGKTNKLRILFNSDFKAEIEGQSIYPLLRLLLPVNDTERGRYGLKQTMVAKTYINALHLDKNSESAKRLINWKDPTKSHGIELSKLIIGDFGTILEDVLRTRVKSEPSDISLGEVNKILDSIAGSLTSDEKIQIIKSKILNVFNAKEQKWIARIIFQDLKIGLNYENVLKAFYPNALQRYNECSNLRIVCEEDGLNSDSYGIQLFSRFSPMLAKGFSMASIGQVNLVEKSMNKDPFVMDIKLDGERMMIHISKERVQLFTRRGNDYTNHYKPLADIIKSSILSFNGIDDCILDGEVCAWDRINKVHIPFGNNLTVAKQEKEYKEKFLCNRHNDIQWDNEIPAWMSFIVFDIVYLTGEGALDLIRSSLNDCHVESSSIEPGEIAQLPLIVRRLILKKLVKPINNRFEIVKNRIVDSKNETERRDQLESYFNEIVLAGEEGLVIKNLTKPYLLGERSRRKQYWVKMKPEYGDQTEDLDLVILGAYLGEGKGFRAEGISTFLCGVRDDNDKEKYYTLCKVGTGYSFEELKKMREYFRDKTILWNDHSPPDHLSHWNITKKDDKPHVYFNPDTSLVLQLKCAELVDSASFSAGLTCRFPRVQRIRYDKPVSEVLKISDIRSLRQQMKKATHEVLGTRKKRIKDKKVLESRKREKIVDEQFSIKNITTQNHGHIFEGLEYCVLENEFHLDPSCYNEETMKLDFKRSEIIEMILSQGGRVVASPSDPECKIIAGSRRTLHLNNYIKSGERDVINFNFIIDCLENGSLLPLKPTYFLGFSKKSKKLFEGICDIFGDSYTEYVDTRELLRIFNSVDAKITTLTNKKKNLELEKEEKDVLKDWELYKDLGWKQIVDQYLLAEERGPVYNRYNDLWRNNVIIYLDIYNELGDEVFNPHTLYERILDSHLDPEGSPDHMIKMRSLYLRLLLKGANISNSLHNKVTHIILDPSDFSRKEKILERIRALRKLEIYSCEKHTVTTEWALSCIDKGCLVEPESFHLIKF